MTADGKTEPYLHGFEDYSLGDIFYDGSQGPETNENEETVDNIDFIVYTSEEIEEILRDEMEEKSHEKK